jgi:hypothetical protein
LGDCFTEELDLEVALSGMELESQVLAL